MVVVTEKYKTLPAPVPSTGTSFRILLSQQQTRLLIRLSSARLPHAQLLFVLRKRQISKRKLSNCSGYAHPHCTYKFNVTISLRSGELNAPCIILNKRHTFIRSLWVVMCVASARMNKWCLTVNGRCGSKFQIEKIGVSRELASSVSTLSMYNLTVLNILYK